MTFPSHAVAVQRETSDGANAARTYSPEDFAQFAPKTALDMLQLVPGFVIAETEDRRGLGETTQNLLLNGNPIEGKANDARSALSRITAAEVLRIEISTSTSADTANVGRQIANVIISQLDRNRRQFMWRPSTRLREFDGAFFNGDASVSGKQGPLSYTVGIGNDALRTGADGPSRILSASGDLIDLRDETYLERSDLPKLSADLSFEGPGTMTGSLRGSYRRYLYRFRQRSEQSGPGLGDRTSFLTQRENDRRFEVAGDLDFELGPGRMKLIGLHAFESSPIDTRITTSFADDSDAFGTRLRSSGDERETVFRSEYSLARGSSDYQLSAERSLTRLDNLSRLFRLLPDGGLEASPFPGGSGNVRDRRYEGALAISRRLSPGLTLQGSLGGEVSRLGLAGEVSSKRTFRRFKGHVGAAWQATPRLRATAKIERQIGQVSFFDFLASRNLSEDRENSANPLLRPPKSWDAEVELSRNLEQLGSTTLRLYGRRIHDLVEQVPIGAVDEAPGNLDRAVLYGVDWKTTLVLDRLGVQGGRVDARVQLQKSAVDDPVTGSRRSISNTLERRIDVSFRRDVPGSPWAWGGGLFHERRASDFRVGELARYRQGPLSGNVYLENKNIAGLTVRGALSNLISSDQDLDRFIYDERRDQPLLSIERRRRSVGPILSLSVSGNF